MQFFTVIFFSCLGIFAAHESALAQQQLRGAAVWQYDDSSIAVLYQGDTRYFTPSEHCSGNNNAPPPGPGCTNAPPSPQISQDPYLFTTTYPLSRQAGGQVYSIDLSGVDIVKKVQIRVLRGAAQIHSASYTKNFAASPIHLSSLIANRLCIGQGLTANIGTSGLNQLNIRAEGFLTNDSAIEVNIQYAKARCGGCNSYGCWIEGGGCNSYGCYTPGSQCNSYGCSVAGGGCNSYGCWYPGGSCNSYGCQKEAPNNAGRASTRPACE